MAKAKGTPVNTRKELKKRADDLAAQDAQAKVTAARLAQIVNLHIAGYSLSQIGGAIGASAEEVDRMLNADVMRYVRTQPALRAYVRNWISERYAKMIEADWKFATDKDSPERLDNQDRVIKILDRMARLHGAHVPVQTEVKIEHAPEAVEKMVEALAAQAGAGYDVSVFDIIDAEIVEDAVEQSHEAMAAEEAVSGNGIQDREDEEL